MELKDWSEVTVYRFLSTYRPGRIPPAALLALGHVNGAELIAYLQTNPLGDDFIKEAAALALKDSEQCWEHCRPALPGDRTTELEQALLRVDAEEDGDIDGKFPPLIETPSFGVGAFALLLAIGLGLSATVFAQPLADWFEQESKQVFVEKLFKYASIPIGTTVFTYVHVWAALWLTFYPLRFSPSCFYQIPGTNVGFPFGWQGIIAFKGDEMARMAVRMIKQHLITVDEVFGKLDPVRMSQILEPKLEAKMQRILGEVFAQEAPQFWSVLPTRVQREIVHQAGKGSSLAVQEMLTDMRPEIESLLDLEHLVVEVLVGDLNLCVDVFVVCGHKELAFIKNIGAAMGFVLGVSQMLVWVYYKNRLFLPVVGCLAGALTNWLALLLIFWPLYPVPLGCGLSLQGRFLMRQKQVAKAYGKLVNRHVLKVENIVNELLFGGRKDRVKEIVRNSVYKTVDLAVRPVQPFLHLVPTSRERVERVKDQVATRIEEEMFDLMMDSREYMEQRFDLEYTLEFRMSRLEPSKFESLLHPIFQAEEWKLVLLGGVVGLLFGVLQANLIMD